MNPRIIAVKPTDDYKLILSFSNGEYGIYDCSHLLNWGIFQELQDKNYFKQVKVVDGTVTWRNEQDICPDTLYLDSIKTHSHSMIHSDLDNQPLSLDLKGLKPKKNSNRYDETGKFWDENDTTEY